MPPHAFGGSTASQASRPKASGVSRKTVHSFIAWFCDNYAEMLGAKYLVRKSKDVPTVRRLLEIYTVDELQVMTRLLFTSLDDWIRTYRGGGYEALVPRPRNVSPRTPARVFGGHPVATLHPDDKRFAIQAVFSHPSSLAVARNLGAQWLVYGPAEAGLEPPAGPAFQSGVVRVYHT